MRSLLVMGIPYQHAPEVSIVRTDTCSCLNFPEPSSHRWRPLFDPRIAGPLGGAAIWCIDWFDLSPKQAWRLQCPLINLAPEEWPDSHVTGRRAWPPPKGRACNTGNSAAKPTASSRPLWRPLELNV